MAPEKESIWKQAGTALKKHLVTILVGGALLVWTEFKDTFNAGAELRMKDAIVKVVIENKTVEDHFRAIVQEEISKTMNDMSTWLKVLDNDFLTDYTDKKTSEIRTFVNKKMEEVDSAQQAFYSKLGVASGLRDEEVLQYLGYVIREFKKKNTIDVVHVPTM